MFRSFGRLFRGSEESPTINDLTSITIYPQCFISTGKEYGSEPKHISVHVRGWVYENPDLNNLGRKDRLMLNLLRRYVGLPPKSKETGTYPEKDDENTNLQVVVDTKAQLNVNVNDGKPNDIELSSTSKTENDPPLSLHTTPDDLQGNGVNVPNPSLSASRSWYQSGYGISGFFNRIMTPSVNSQYISTIGLAKCEEYFEERSLASLQRGLKDEFVLVKIYATDKNFEQKVVAEFNVATNVEGYFIIDEVIPFYTTKNNKFSVEAVLLQSTSENKVIKAYMSEVPVLDRNGISIISDIDDTVKNTRVIEGPRKVGETTLLAPLNTQTIEGVSDWFRVMTNLNATVHFVSNSPWQLWPTLSKFFTNDNMPYISSIYLRHFNGVLQNIIEPAAARKRSSLLTAIRSLGDRKIVLIGDNGEQDLQIYAEMAACFPERILGIFIRDVMSDFCGVLKKQTTKSNSLPEVVQTKPFATSTPDTPLKEFTTTLKDVDNEQASEFYQLEKEPDTVPSTFILHRYYTYRIFVEDRANKTRKPVVQVEHAASKLENVHILCDYCKHKCSNIMEQDWFVQLARARGVIPLHIPIVIWFNGEEPISFTEDLLKSAFAS